jgi:hypothetical protein
MTTFANNPVANDPKIIGSRVGRIDPDNFKNQSGAAMEDGDEDEEETVEESDLDDEPVDDEGDPTGEHDHHQDDNYALGGHVTRSSS